MDVAYAPEDEAFRLQVRARLEEHLTGPYAGLGLGADLGGPKQLAVRRASERELPGGSWIGIAWAEAPLRCGFFGGQQLGSTLMPHGTAPQRDRFLKPVLVGEAYWCHGFSEPDAGSDPANFQSKTVLDGGEWRITGQKVWTNLGHIAHWIFVLCRTDPDAHQERRPQLSALLHGPGRIEVRPIRIGERVLGLPKEPAAIGRDVDA